MDSLHIADIYLKVEDQVLYNELQVFQNNYTYPDMTHKCSQLRMQRSGQEMEKIVIENDDGDRFIIVAERDNSTGDITFKPTKIKSLGKTFYESSYSNPDNIGQDEDPSLFFVQFMRQMCGSHNGTFAYMDSTGHMDIIKDGKHEQVESLAIANSNGVIYSIFGAKTIGDVDENQGSNFKIKKFWKEWLAENTDVAHEVNKLSDLSDKFNLMGKLLIQKKMQQEITFEEFQDVFIQICSYDIITDKTVLNFYELLK